MKYAITSRGESPDDYIDIQFGRCAYIVLYEPATGGWECIPNPYKDLDEHVGPKLVEMLSDKGVTRIVAGSFGKKIKDLMDSKKIQMIIPKSNEVTVQSIIETISQNSS